MFKKLIISGLTLAMVLGGTTSAFAHDNNNGHDSDGLKAEHKAEGKVHKKFDFDDLKGKDIEWAMKSIIRLAAEGVFAGYGDGTFRPRQTVSRIEALAA